MISPSWRSGVLALMNTAGTKKAHLGAYATGTPSAQLYLDVGPLVLDGDNMKIQFGEDQDFDIYHSGSHGYIDNNTGTLYISGATSIGDGAGTNSADISDTGTLSFAGSAGLIIPSGTAPTPATEGALFLDTDASANGTLVMYSNGAWRTVAGW